MLHRQHGRATPLGAHREPLRHTQSRQQRRRVKPPLGIGRQHSDRGRHTETHQHQRAYQNRLAPQPVSEVTRHNRTDGPGPEPGRVGGERRQSPRPVGEMWGKNNGLNTSAETVAYR